MILMLDSYDSTKVLMHAAERLSNPPRLLCPLASSKVTSRLRIIGATNPLRHVWMMAVLAVLTPARAQVIGLQPLLKGQIRVKRPQPSIC